MADRHPFTAMGPFDWSKSATAEKYRPQVGRADKHASNVPSSKSHISVEPGSGVVDKTSPQPGEMEHLRQSTPYSTPTKVI